MERMNYSKIQSILNECDYEKEHLDFDKIGNKLNEGMGMPNDRSDFRNKIIDTIEYYTPRKLREKYVGMIYNLDNSWDTFYIDEDGEMVDSVKLAKVFDDEDEAEEWAYENRPVGWGAYGSRIKEATIPQAKRFAARKHGERGQIRKATGLPYIVHPEGVAALVKDAGGDDEQVQAAWLHDTMEDTGTTYDDLVEKFGKRVADLVASVTNDPYLKKENKEAYMSNKLEHLPHDALLVKLCDFDYNLHDFCPNSTLLRMYKNLKDLKHNRQNIDNKCKIVLEKCLSFAENEVLARNLI